MDRTAVADVLGRLEPFRYYHEGVWKEGYYDRQTRLFVGVVDEVLATVIKGATQAYIEKLLAGGL